MDYQGSEEETPFIELEAVKLESDQIPFKNLSTKQIWKIAKEIFINALPLILTFEAPMITGLINIYFLRQYDSGALVGGYGLGLHWNSIFLLSITLSVNQGLSVLISSAYGAKNYDACAVYLQRGFFILLIFLGPCLTLLYFSEPLMLAIGIRPELAKYAGELTIYYLPSLFLYANFDMLKSFVTAHTDFYPVLYIHAVSLTLHPFWAWLFIEHFGLEIKGVGLARFCEEVTNLTAIYIYIKRSDLFKETFKPITRKSLEWESFKDQLKFTITLGSINFFEYFYFEIMSLLGGTFTLKDAVANVAVHDTCVLAFIFYLGLSATSMIYVSKHLGEKLPNKARNYGIIAGIIIGAVALGFVLVLVSFMGPWEQFWSDSPGVQSYIRKMFILFLFTVLPADGLNAAFLGILKGCGRQKYASISLFICYYGIAGPLGLYLAYLKDYNIYGLWIGFAVADVVLVIMYFTQVEMLDWKKLVTETEERIERAIA
jgi:multidrug resistance protein, MATE family